MFGKNIFKITVILVILLSISISGIGQYNFDISKNKYRIYHQNYVISNINFNTISPTVKINLNPYETVYEGDIIYCDIIGEPSMKYWQINGLNKHTTFYENNPIIFDPEPTPLQDKYVNFTVYVENEMGSDSDTVEICIKKIFFGDIHWHTTYSDGKYSIDTMYNNARIDNYLDFTACTDHAELLNNNKWQSIKNYTEKYYEPGRFTTLLGFEYTGSQLTPGGSLKSPNGCEDVSHINFYYKEVYPDAKKYSSLIYLNYNSIFRAMSNEWDKGHLNIGFPHHPIAQVGNVNRAFSYTTNWSFLTELIKNKKETENMVLRGVEVYSHWGTAIGYHYTNDLTWFWPYKNYYDQKEAWVEDGIWEWSKINKENRKFAFIASSDTHKIDRPGSAIIKQSLTNLEAPSGLVAVYAVHNTREEIWDALNKCEIYASQLLKIRANVRFNNQLIYGRTIDYNTSLKIQITAHSTYPGLDSCNRNMCPYGYLDNELQYPISDIWLIKNDNELGKPWCKVIKHWQPNENYVVINYEDKNVQPNDFYWVVIKQKGQSLGVNNYNDYAAYIGPIFIDDDE